MAEIDSGTSGQSGNNTTSGSILSKDVRNAVLKNNAIDSSIFRNDLLASENRRRQIDLENSAVIREQEKALIGFNSSIQSLRSDIGKLGVGLENIALLLRQDGAEEQNRIRQDQEKERRLAEQQIRIGKENQLEQKIQNAVTEPVERLVPKVNDIFGRIGAALSILFGGWLTNQVVQAIRASEEKNTKLFNDIKFNIVKNLAIVGGGLFAIRAGFSLVKRSISGIASGLTKLLIAKPLAAAASLIPGMGRRTTSSGGGGGIKPGGGRSGLNVRGNLAIGSLMTGIDIASGENPGRAIAGAVGGMVTSATAFGLGSLLPIPMSGVISGALAYGPGQNFAKDIYDKFFGNSNKNSGMNSSGAPTSSSKPMSMGEPSSTQSTPPTTQLSVPTTQSTPPMVQPQTPMMGEKPTSSPPSPDMVSKFEQAWQYRNNPMARGKIEGAWNQMTPDQKQQAKDWAASKGYDWREMKLQESPSMADFKQEPPKQIDESKPAQAEISPTPKPSQEVGQLPEPKPTLTMIKTSTQQMQQPEVPLTSGALSDVPLINSANPDNFYVLYSQLNYNVVM